MAWHKGLPTMTKKIHGYEGLALTTIFDAMMSTENRDGLKVWINGRGELVSQNWLDCLWLLTDAVEFMEFILKDDATNFHKQVRAKVGRTAGYRKLREKVLQNDADAKMIKEKLAEYGLSI